MRLDERGRHVCEVSDHRREAWAIREAEAALGKLHANGALTRNERRRVLTMLRSLGVVQSNLEEKLLEENPRGGDKLLHVYYR